MAEIILIDARKKTIHKATLNEEQRTNYPDYLHTSIILKQRRPYSDLVSAMDPRVPGDLVASDCGFILRYSGKRFIIPGCVVIERLYGYDEMQPVDTPFSVDDFVFSDKEVTGKYAIQWL